MLHQPFGAGAVGGSEQHFAVLSVPFDKSKGNGVFWVKSTCLWQVPLWALAARAMVASGSLRRKPDAKKGATGMTGDDARSARRSEILRFRLSEPEAEAFRGFCESHGLSVTEALRRMARGAAGLGPTFSGEGHTQIVELTRQVRAVGVNLNQTVHHMNAGQAFPAEEVHSWLEETLGVIRALDTLYSSLAARARSRADAAVETLG
jgi:hypothetical protein